ncbi:MAG: alpha/beta hydrolase [Pseudomonadota bacterium]
MPRPSLHLRLLTLGMRLLTKPKLSRTATPDQADRDFERGAPLLFSAPRGLIEDIAHGLPRFRVGTAKDTHILYLHGGAFVCGSSRSYRAMAGRLAKRTGATVYVPDYPRLQEAPFPAACEAVHRAWAALRSAGIPAGRIAIAGDSAGGNLVFGLLARVLADGERPAAIVAFSPWVDLTLTAPSLADNERRDPLLPRRRMEELVELYLAGADPKDERASPVRSDFPNPPPILIQVGEDEILLDDSRAIAAKAGATLQIWPHVPHVWQIFDGRLPEANAAMRDVAAFLQTSFDKASR